MSPLTSVKLSLRFDFLLYNDFRQDIKALFELGGQTTYSMFYISSKIAGIISTC